MKNDIDYLNTLYPNIFIKMDFPYPARMTSVRPTKQNILIRYEAEKLGYKTQLLSNNKIGIWKCLE